MGKNNLHHFYNIPTRPETDTFVWNENLSHCASQRIPLCTGGKSSLYPGILYQLLYANQYFLNTALRFYITHTAHTIHTHKKKHMQELIQKEKVHIDCKKGAQINIIANKIVT